MTAEEIWKQSRSAPDTWGPSIVEQFRKSGFKVVMAEGPGGTLIQFSKNPSEETKSTRTQADKTNLRKQ